MLIVDRRRGDFRHARVADFPGMLAADCFLVVNDTRVLPARLFGTIDGKDVEMLVVNWQDEQRADVLASPASRFRVGSTVVGDEWSARIEAIGFKGKRTVRFSIPSEQVMAGGYAPLPPYIKRKRRDALSWRELDLERYQTVFAYWPGSIAAPTAGLHFSPEILARLRSICPVLPVTLHVGEATFRKIEVEDLSRHVMGSERVTVPFSVRDRIDALKKAGKKLLAVGTTSVRAIESLRIYQPQTEEFSTQLFIYPGFQFAMVDRLLTNFHLPESSLFVLVSAFAGLELMKEAYRLAIGERYRFFSYGDAMLIV